jgi:hypothetical protein
MFQMAKPSGGEIRDFVARQFGANTLGNLSYTYDSLGRRTQVGINRG